MREFVFRGKPKNRKDYELYEGIHKDNCKNGFVYGSLVIRGEQYYICVNVPFLENTYVLFSNVTLFEVIPETVGQYTGFDDKNGKKVFEGDILKAEIWWEQGGCYPHTETRFIEATFPNMYKNHFEKFEVVGNIYDNPELLRR